jgi:hypothetical protein
MNEYRVEYLDDHAPSIIEAGRFEMNDIANCVTFYGADGEKIGAITNVRSIFKVGRVKDWAQLLGEAAK